MKLGLLARIATFVVLGGILAVGQAWGAEKSKGVIGVSLLTQANPFFVDMGNAIREEAAKNGMDVIITSGEFDAAKQKDQVADFIVKHVSAIILCPCDSKAVGTSIAEANKAGIPVFTREDWLCHLNRIVKCECSDCIDRRSINRGKSLG